jgi:ABC-type phosphate transport system substrate-binding protein
MPLARPGFVALLIVLSAAAAGSEDLAVIVHASRQASLTPAELARIYLRQRRHWRDGEPILPVNREAGSSSRRLFVRRIFGGDTRRLAVYWNQQYFKGVLPPATLASDEAVRRFVAGEPRSIGYVAASAVDESVRVVLRLPNDASP